MSGRELLSGVRSRFVGDATLSGIVAAVHIEQRPDTPEDLTDDAVVVIANGGGPDASGRHGGGVDSAVEIEVWGYGPGSRRPAQEAADRIDVLMLEPFTSATGGGPTTRWGSDTGWESLPEQDPDTVHLRALYRTRQWPAARAQRLESL